MLAKPTITILGPDPSHRRCVLNGNAFQQDAIASFRGWQYAAFYSFLDAPEPLYIHLGRRKLPTGPWEVLLLKDYPQTTDDGHNTVQLGICPGDGSIHLSFDHHCDKLRYRISKPSVALDPPSYPWSPDLFFPTQEHLPGLPKTHTPFHYVTYPRFLPIPDSGELLFTLRDGKAGLGNDHLYLYARSPSESSYTFTYLGQYLTGRWSNPYIHGLDYRAGKVHVTWVWREWVCYKGWDDPADTQHKMQAGPNGAENNRDMCYAWSPDLGRTWKNSDGATIADLAKEETIDNDSKGITAFSIPKGSGLTNQEAQVVDGGGGVHVLNRDTLDGKVIWRHYHRSPDAGVWTKRPVCPAPGSARGKLAVTAGGDLYFILPDREKSELRILRGTSATGFSAYDEVWAGKGLSGEPLIDMSRLEDDGTLSVFLRMDFPGSEKRKNVVVLDFQL
ncbi:hypothetical protein B0T16DRAFT_315354 [Cercophora newfieldiana]|uniref:Dockerin type 1 n=1 Tax=Cercophora newfieldiana TaxID=92897 RepID=A0AA39YSV1_9PEZI|nr:hypothetical protein B0T16DRAFT_315354 [Cercophora newfieldiana]